MLKKRILVMSIILILIISLCSCVYATELKTELSIIQQASETKYLENNQGYISKTIVDSNKDTGEVTIELKLSNTAKEIENITDTELLLVVDNSPSMDFVTSTGKTRKEIVLNSASRLVESIFGISSNIRMGLIDFHGYGLFSGSASIYDATVRQELTDDKKTVLNAISKELERSTSSGTNIEAGLRTAMEEFSTSANNKVVILLTDGLPNADINGNHEDDDITSEQEISILNSTKQAILDLKSNDIYVITMLTGMSESDGNTDKEGNVYNSENTIEEQLSAAERVFGTSENPTGDKYYLVKSADINNIINNDILQDVSNKIRKPINTVKIVDYFPKDITENFAFSYVENASIGTASDSIDLESKTITWNIGTLKGDEVATLKYKLKIKDMKNTELLEKTISTNEKVVLTYKDIKANDYTVTLTSSPQIKLSKTKEELTATVSYEPTSETTETVKATITTNKQVSKVDGWTLSDDGMTLTKEYSRNAIETVHLVDIDEMTKDVVIVIDNIKDDATVVKATFPQTGISRTIIFIILAVITISIICYKKYNSYKDVK